MNARVSVMPVEPDESDAIARFVDSMWDDQIVPRLVDYIAVPAKSPMFDPDWAANGYLEKVVRDAAS